MQSGVSSATGSTAALTDHVAFTVGLRWIAVVVGAIVTWRTSHGSDVVAGLPIAAFAGLRTGEEFVTFLRPGWMTNLTLAAELAAAAAAVGATGGWHSGWVVTLVVLAGIVGFTVPMRQSGQIGAAAVIVVFLVNLITRNWLSPTVRTSIDLDALLVVAVLAVSYASWLGRFGDADRAILARANQRLMATNDLLVMLEQTVLRGEYATDPQQAARVVARLARKLLSPSVVVVAASGSIADTWRVLNAEGVALPAIVDDLKVLRRMRALVAGGQTKPVAMDQEGELLAVESQSGICIPLVVRGRAIGAILIESEADDRWSESDFDVMSQLSEWASLLVDNACRFHALWVVGSAEEKARVARNLHDSLGQSMAALGLQLDWIARTTEDEAQVARIRELRADVTGMVAELRYTMRDLSTEVTTECSLGDALRHLVQSVSARAGTKISLDVRGELRLPVAQEHQLLLMARTLLGAAIDSRAESVLVKWQTEEDGACLEVGYSLNPTMSADSAAPGGEYETEAPIVSAVAEVQDRCWAVGATMETDLERDRCRIRCMIAA
jgi:signal transduction histidine kinase